MGARPSFSFFQWRIANKRIARIFSHTRIHHGENPCHTNGQNHKQNRGKNKHIALLLTSILPAFTIPYEYIKSDSYFPYKQ